MRFEQFYFSEQLLTYFPAYSHEEPYLPEPLVDCYIDPTQAELNKLYAEAEYHGVRAAMDSLGRLFVWNENVLHADMQRKFDTYDGDKKMIKGTKFVIKFIYTKGDKRIFISQDQEEIKSERSLLKVITKEKLRRLRLFFPLAVSINTQDKHKEIFRIS